ncbi:MAG TPA: trehalose-6-phosphate synthase, partial [Burkholderiales bacterium]|nr:trehalose-6-phosphate synthase [Burkholderiales bacterium]
MRISLRFILPLAVALTAIAYAVVPLVDRLTLNWFVRDLEIRAKLITSATQEPLGALVREPKARQKIMRFFDRLVQDERVYAVGFCDNAGKLAYATRGFPETVRCPAPDAPEQTELLQRPDGPLLVSA